MMSHMLSEVDADRNNSFNISPAKPLKASGLSKKKVRVTKPVNTKYSAIALDSDEAEILELVSSGTARDTVDTNASQRCHLELLRAENEELKMQLKAQSTELSEARAEALHAMELKAQFMANVSHELRTPLSGVLGMAELLKGMTLTSDQEELVNHIYVSAAGLVDVVNSLLDFSRLQSGKLRIERAKFSVLKMLEGVRSNFSEQASRKELRLEIFIGKDVPESVFGDEVRIRQVLIGLTNNAIKFSERGTIQIQAQLVKNFDEMAVVKFVVKDSGIGIPVSEQERIFMPFVQVDGSSTRRYGGVGLGLPICKLLVQLMSGSMSLTSSAGKGSSFSFSLPLEVNN